MEYAITSTHLEGYEFENITDNMSEEEINSAIGPCFEFVIWRREGTLFTAKVIDKELRESIQFADFAVVDIRY